MTEPHDPPGDGHEHDVPPADGGLHDDGGHDAFTEHQPLPLDDLAAPADTPAELHFPGDEITAPATRADADPAAPWPDDADFTSWLHAGTESGPDGAQLPDQLFAAPHDADALPSSDALVDWTLRELTGED
jgi:hypothetical protein